MSCDELPTLIIPINERRRIVSGKLVKVILKYFDAMKLVPLKDSCAHYVVI